MTEGDAQQTENPVFGSELHLFAQQVPLQKCDVPKGPAAGSKAFLKSVIRHAVIHAGHM